MLVHVEDIPSRLASCSIAFNVRPVHFAVGDNLTSDVNSFASHGIAELLNLTPFVKHGAQNFRR
jgi:hypothetical protein